MDYTLSAVWELLFVAALAAGEFVFVLKRPIWATGVLFALLPTYLLRIRTVIIPTNLLEILIWSFFLGYLFSLLQGRASLPHMKKIVAIGLGLFFLAGTVSTGLNTFSAEPELRRMILGAWKGNIFDPFLLLLALSGLFSGERERTSVFRGYLMGAVVVSIIALVLGILQKSFLVGGLSAVTYDDRLRGFYLSPNHLAMFLTPALVILLFWTKSFSWQIRWVCIVLLSSTVFLTQSFGALLAVLVGILSGLLMQAPWRRLLPYYGAAILLVGLLLPFFAVHFSSHIVVGEERSSLASRIMIWRSAEGILHEHWLFGIGPGAFQEHYLALQKDYPQYLEWAAPQPHNLLLSVWLQAGVLGLLGFLLLLIGRFCFLIVSVPSSQIATSAALVAILVYGFVDTPFWKNDLSILFLFFLGAL